MHRTASNALLTMIEEDLGYFCDLINPEAISESERDAAPERDKDNEDSASDRLRERANIEVHRLTLLTECLLLTEVQHSAEEGGGEGSARFVRLIRDKFYELQERTENRNLTPEADQADREICLTIESMIYALKRSYDAEERYAEYELAETIDAGLHEVINWIGGAARAHGEVAVQ